MEAYLIRHTTPKIEKGICYGQTDLELADGFRQEMAGVKKQLPDRFDKVFSSPLRRCRLLAEQLSQAITFDPRLMEINFGQWEMKSWDDIPKDEIAPWMKDYVHISPPGGESLGQMSGRVLAFWKVFEQQTFQRVAIVTHSGVIRVVLSFLKRNPLKDCFNYPLEYGEVRRVVL